MPPIQAKLREFGKVLEDVSAEAIETFEKGDEADAMEHFCRRVSMVVLALYAEARAIEETQMIVEGECPP